MIIDKYKLTLEILDYFNSQPPDKYTLRSNVIGLEYQEGNFGQYHNRNLSNEERSMLDLTLRDLQEKRLIQPVYRDIISRGEDLQITDKGRKALEEKVLDEMDELLLALASGSDLIVMRYGAYDAILGKQNDWQRQAATSLVELVDHILRAIAPNEEIKKQPWYSPDATSRTGITRKHRVRYFLEHKNGSRSESTEQVINKAWELLETARTKLENIKHTNDEKKEIEQLIKLTEDALMFLLR